MAGNSWSTREALDPGFERAWRERVSRAPQAHFAFDPGHLEAEARHGRHAMAVLIEEGARAAALVLRDEGGEWVSGWPWRWQGVLEGGDPTTPGLSHEDARWLFDQANRAAGGKRLRCFLPSPPPSDVPGFAVATSYFTSLERDEAALLQTMDKEKQRMVRRCATRGYSVVEAREADAFRAFAEIQRDTEARRGADPAPLPDRPEPGESWREWELPWMWLLVAVKDGKVEAGSGFGRSPGGTIDYRTNASSITAKNDGANVALAWEAMRRGREAGNRWMNWGGSTHFKKDLGGVLVGIECWLGGAAPWWPANWAEAAARNARLRMGQLIRERRSRAKPKRAAPPGAPDPRRS